MSAAAEAASILRGVDRGLRVMAWDEEPRAAGRANGERLREGDSTLRLVAKKNPALAAWRDKLEDGMREADERTGRTRIVTDMAVMWPTLRTHSTRRFVIGGELATPATLSDPDRRVKYLDRGTIAEPEHPFSASDFARQYMVSIRERQGYARGMRSPKAIPFRREQCSYFDIGTPWMFRGRVEDADLAYVDIRGAYHQIYSPLSLDVEYQRDTGVIANGRCLFLDAAELGQDKMVRNTLIGLTHPMRLRIWKAGQVSQFRCRNEWYAPQLWAIIQDTLHCAMADVLSVLGGHVHYVNTDGLICDADVARDVISLLRLRWGLIAGIDAQGRGSIYGSGRYRIENSDGTTKGLGRPSRHQDNNGKKMHVLRLDERRFERIREARLNAVDFMQHNPWADFDAYYG